ncbi:uncharacterized protein LOC128991077 [Macrosteles quadrilineatus]|uniref:uncharacterized protein LOC128991077 n=1 Tax=Macrosteles quadrilineatus TaxID=74068 RepID=UPI0023E0FD23|nr:uncharacterized protein LOC128991077 [Macrosteles quadrilineatus]
MCPRMLKSCVFLVLLLGVLTRGDDGATNSIVTNVSPQSPTRLQPAMSLMMDLPESPRNGLGESRGIVQDTQESPAAPMPALEIPVSNGPEEAVMGLASGDNLVKEMTEEMQGSPREVPLSEQKLARRKRTFSKHKGCMICGMMPKILMKHPMYAPPQPCYSCQQQPMYHPPPPPPRPVCDPCQQQQQHYQPPPPPPPQHYSPCGGGGCGGSPMSGSWSSSQSSAQSSSSAGSWGKKK